MSLEDLRKRKEHAFSQVSIFSQRQGDAERKFARCRNWQPKICCQYTNPSRNDFIQDGCLRCTILYNQYQVEIWGQLLANLGELSQSI